RAMAVALRIDEEVELVSLRRPPRHARGFGLVPLMYVRRPIVVGGVEHRALRHVEELAGSLALVAPLPKRVKEPERVLLDWAAQCEARIKDVVDGGDGREAAGAQGVGQIVALQTGAGEEAGDAAPEGVAAFLGNEVYLNAVGVAVGRDPARGEHRFLHDFLVLVGALVALRVLYPHAVERDVGAPLAMVSATDLSRVASSDVETFVASKSGRECHEVIHVLHTARQRVEQVTGDQRLLASSSRVDERRLARHRNRLRESSDLHVRVYRRREPRRQLDAIPLEGGEAA